MTKRKVEIAALGVASISLLFSGLALGFSVYVFNIGRVESLAIEASLAMGSNDLRCLPSGGESLRLLQVPAKVVISNNSDRTVSVIGYEVYELVGEGRRAMYTDIASGLRSGDGTHLRPPFSLASGESTSFEVLLGLMPSHSAKLILQESALCDIPFTRSDLMRTLGRESIDLYGNAVSIREYTDGLHFEGPSNGGRQQLFLLRFYTGRGAAFETQTSWYPSSEFMSGAF